MAEIPTGVKVISVLYYVLAALTALGGVMMLVMGAGFGVLAGRGGLGAIVGAIGVGVFIVAGIIAIAFGILEFFVARGLWNARNWARIVAIIFSAIGILGALGVVGGTMVGGIISNLFWLVVNALIGGYLLLSKEAKAVFIR